MRVLPPPPVAQVGLGGRHVDHNLPTAWHQAHRPLVSVPCLTEPPLVPQIVCQIVVDLPKLRVQLQPHPQQLYAPRYVGTRHNAPKVAVVVCIFWIRFHCVAVGCLCLAPARHGHQAVAQVVVCVSVLWHPRRGDGIGGPGHPKLVEGHVGVAHAVVLHGETRV